MTSLLLIGCGKMGSAILKGIIQKKLPLSISLSDHHDENVKPFIKYSSIQKVNDIKTINHQFDLVILAVKPQSMESLLEDIEKSNLRSACFLSVAAGKTLKFFEERLSPQTAIIRTMPNLPASIGEGMTVAIANNYVKEKTHILADQILKSVGETLWIQHEEWMDAITALSGSGPAYLFYLVETLAKAGHSLGLPLDIATKLSTQTIIGSAHLLSETQKSSEELRQEVTSHKGTTEEALKILQKNDIFEKLFEEALFAAQQRAKELSQ